MAKGRIWLIGVISITLIGCGGSGSSEQNASGTTNMQIAENDSSTTPLPFIPPEGKTLLFVGQDSDTVKDYIAAVPEDTIEGVTLYSQLKSADPTETLKAIFAPAHWQSGTMDFNQTLSASPNAALAVGLAIDNCNQENHESNIATGRYDKTIDTMVQHFHSLAPRKIFLRIGYEFDGPWNCYSPENYKRAFIRIAEKIKSNGASNIATVWQSATWPDSYGNPDYDNRDPEHLNKWYPGDDYVDWVSMSAFYRDLSQWNYTPPSTPAAAQEAVLAFARSHNKPVMIAEAAPQGYRTGELTRSVIQENAPTSTTAQDIWNNWYQPLFDFIDENNDVIKALAYINTHWDSQQMWQCQLGHAAGTVGCPQGNWGDSRIQANDFIKSKWLEQVNNEQRWLQSGSY